jgi:hypothetical protein
VTTALNIERWLANVTFAPSCVDMGWEWEVLPIYDEGDAFSDPNLFSPAPFGYAIRTTFQRPDRDTGVISTGFGRWWLVPNDVTESGVVKTAYKAAMLILEHELMESFRYEGVRLFDPHHDVEDLRVAASHRLGRAT